MAKKRTVIQQQFCMFRDAYIGFDHASPKEAIAAAHLLLAYLHRKDEEECRHISSDRFGG